MNHFGQPSRCVTLHTFNIINFRLLELDSRRIAQKSQYFENTFIGGGSADLTVFFRKFANAPEGINFY